VKVYYSLGLFQSIIDNSHNIDIEYLSITNIVSIMT